MLRKNDIAEIEITGTTAEGSGVGRYDGIAIFVPQTAQGDTVRVRIVKVCKNYCFGKIEEIVTPSPARISPDCPNFRQCGGCVYRHISYEEECRIKRQKVDDAVRRIGGFDLACEDILASPCPDRYRNKAQLPCVRDSESKMRFGFYATHSHRVIPLEDCLLQPAEFASIVKAFGEFCDITKAVPYDETTGKGRVRHLYIRRSNETGEIMVCIVVNGNGLHEEELLVEMLRKACPDIVSVVININREKTNVILGSKCRTVWGRETIREKIAGVELEISPLSFVQVNPVQTSRLYARAAEYAALGRGETLLDLYCGAGTIGLSMAKEAGQVIGVEIVPQAIENARKSAQMSGINNARFICADALEASEQLRDEGIKPDVIMLDPPRKGLDERLVPIIAGMNAKRIVYVSCDCATLARDMKRLSEYGYKPMRLSAVDMFPRTAHVESVALLSREQKR